VPAVQVRHSWYLGVLQVRQPGPQDMHTSDLGSKDHPSRQPLQLPPEQSEQPGGQYLIWPAESMATVGADPGTVFALLLARACSTETWLLTTWT
jgi:hypothetical protein